MFRSPQRTYQCRQWLPASVEEVFPFFADAKNLEQITPPWLNFKIIFQSQPQITKGCIFKYKLRVHGIPVRWTTEIVEWLENKEFVDNQVSGPYALWHHTHLFVPKDGGTEMTDIVRYRLPLGILGDFLMGRFVEKDVSDIFDYRAKVISSLFLNKH